METSTASRKTNRKKAQRKGRLLHLRKIAAKHSELVDKVEKVAKRKDITSDAQKQLESHISKAKDIDSAIVIIPAQRTVLKKPSTVQLKSIPQIRSEKYIDYSDKATRQYWANYRESA